MDRGHVMAMSAHESLEDDLRTDAKGKCKGLSEYWLEQ